MIETTKTSLPQRGGTWRWLFWIFAALGVATAIAIVWLAIMLGGSFPEREPAVVAANEPGVTFVVGEVSQLAGTDFVAIEINALREAVTSGSGKGYRNETHNILLLDRATGKSRRILPDNRNRIADIKYLPAARQTRTSRYSSESDEPGLPPPSFYLLQVERKVQEMTTLDVIVGTISSGQQAIVMKGISGIEQSAMLDQRRLGLVVRQGQSLYFRIVDAVDRKILESHKIEIG